MFLVELGGLITEVYCQLKPKRSPTKKAQKAFQVGEELVANLQARVWGWDSFESSGMVILYLQNASRVWESQEIVIPDVATSGTFLDPAYKLKFPIKE